MTHLGSNPHSAVQPFGLPAPGSEVYEKSAPLFDFRELLGAITRNLWIIALAVAACILVALVYLMTAPRIYEATSQVEVNRPLPNPLGTLSSEGQPSADSNEVTRTIQTQVDLLGTREMASAVLERLRASGKHTEQLASYEPETIQGMMDAVVPRNSRVVPISVLNPDPVLAADIANAYAVTLVDKNLELQRQSIASSRDFLADQLETARSDLEKSKQALVDYATRAGIVDTSAGSTTGQGTSSLPATSLLELNSSLAQVQADRIQAQQRWNEARNTPLLSLPQVIGNSAVQNLLQQKAAAEAQLAQDRQRYGANYPGVKQQVANIERMDQEIAKLASNVRNSLRNEYRAAQKGENALAGQVAAIKGATLAEQARGVQYGVLQRDAATSQELYDGLLQRFKEVSAELGLGSNPIAVVDPAVPPEEPASPSSTTSLGLAIVAGLAIGMIAAFLRENLDNLVRNPARALAATGLPVLATFPSSKDSEDTEEASMAAAFASYRLLDRLELGRGRQLPQIICLTSCGDAHGDPVVASGLAAALSDSGRSVLSIVSTDGAINDNSTFSQFVNGKAINGTLPGHRLEYSPNENEGVRSSLDHMRASLAKLRSSYDCVVIDAPGLMKNPNALRFAALADATLFVVTQLSSRKDAMLECAQTLQQTANVEGAVVIERKRSPWPSLPRIFRRQRKRDDWSEAVA